MSSTLETWQFWALLSAVFAALTAIFAKVGVENVNSDFATLIRTVVILLVLGAIVAATGQAQALSSISGKTTPSSSCRDWRRARHGSATSALSSWATPLR